MPRSTAARHDGTTAIGVPYVLEIPPSWNGTLLLYSPGYSSEQRPADAAGSEVVRRRLLRAGFALVGGAYRSTGWALDRAIDDQIAVLEAASGYLGGVDATIAWGHSMGGLVTAGIAERHGDAVDAAVPFCGSVAGAIPMMNQALDGAFVFRALCVLDLDLPLVGVSADGPSRSREVAELVKQARTTPAGRARVALAASVAQLPTWTVDNLIDGSVVPPSEPAVDDLRARQDQQASVFHLGAFSPRGELEQRAGGNFSWNDGIDYAVQLRRSGLEQFVQDSYDEAHLDLDGDLNRLAEADRIAADPSAVAYMERHLTPTGALGAPVLTVSLLGDFAPTVTQTSAYRDACELRGADGLLRQLFVNAPGHCAAFEPDEILAGLEIARSRAVTGDWDHDPPDADDRWPRTRFVEHSPADHVRPYWTAIEAAV